MTREALIKRLLLVPEAAGIYARSVRHAGGHPIAVAHLLARSLRRGFWPTEAFLQGLLNPSLALPLFELLESKRSMVRLQRRINPAGWEAMLSDKGVFYRYCQVAGLPVPPLVAIYDRQSGGWTAVPPVPARDDEWARFFETRTPPSFVVKPTRGRHGHSMLFLDRNGEGTLTRGGKPISGAEIVRMLGGDREYGAFVVQERLRTHPILAELMGAEGLVTSRMVTYRNRRGDCSIIGCDLKVLVGKNLTSNLSMGATGNMAATVSVETGRITTVRRVVPGDGFVEIERHPTTGALFRGFEIPLWHRGCELARRAAERFLPVRTIGWDIAFTPDGPVLIEGNFFFDPQNSTLSGRSLVRVIEEDARL